MHNTTLPFITDYWNIKFTCFDSPQYFQLGKWFKSNNHFFAFFRSIFKHCIPQSITYRHTHCDLLSMQFTRFAVPGAQHTRSFAEFPQEDFENGTKRLHFPEFTHLQIDTEFSFATEPTTRTSCDTYTIRKTDNVNIVLMVSEI